MDQPKTITAGDKLLTAVEVADLVARCERYEYALRGIADMGTMLSGLLPPAGDVPRPLALGPLLTMQGLADSALERT